MVDGDNQIWRNPRPPLLLSGNKIIGRIKRIEVFIAVEILGIDTAAIGCRQGKEIKETQLGASMREAHEKFCFLFQLRKELLFELGQQVLDDIVLEIPVVDPVLIAARTLGREDDLIAARQPDEFIDRVMHRTHEKLRVFGALDQKPFRASIKSGLNRGDQWPARRLQPFEVGALIEVQPALVRRQFLDALGRQREAAAIALIMGSEDCVFHGIATEGFDDEGIGGERLIEEALAVAVKDIGPDAKGKGEGPYLGKRFRQPILIFLKSHDQIADTVHGRDVAGPGMTAHLGENSAYDPDRRNGK